MRAETISLVLCLSWGAAVATAQDGPLFAQPQAPILRALDPDVRLADLDDDGHLDLVGLDGGGGEIVVALGRGDGTFAPASTTPTSAASTELRVADVDVDGIDDILVIELGGAGTSELLVYLGVGDGTFLAPIVTPVLNDAHALTLGDLDDDGVPDATILFHTVAGVGPPQSTVWALRGLGDGSFALSDALSYPVGYTEGDATTADLDADGDQDVLLTYTEPTLAGPCTSSAEIRVLLGCGDGTLRLGPFVCEATPGGTLSDEDLDVVVAALNGDALADLVVANGARIDTFLGVGDGAFVMTASIDEPVGRIDVADFDGDGVLDLVTNRDFPYRVDVRLGAGDGTFGPARSTELLFRSSTVRVAHLDDDGVLDLLLIALKPAEDDGLPVVLLGRGDRTFETHRDVTPSDSVIGLVAEDIDGDGVVDVVTTRTDTGGRALEAFLGRGDGSFEDGVLSPSGFVPQQLRAGDLDGDGDVDLAYTVGTSQLTRVVLGAGDGTFGPPSGYASRTQDIELCDVDADGDLDLLTVGSNALSVRRGVGDGTFGPENVYGTTPTSNRLALADADGDGLPEAFTEEVMLVNLGDARFDAPVALPTGGETFDIAAGDLDLDGDVDLVIVRDVCGGCGRFALRVLLGAGDGTFAVLGEFDAPLFASEPRIVDVDDDGLPDVLVSSTPDRRVGVFAGNGDGTLAPAEVFLVGGVSTMVLAPADANGDGATDLVAGVGFSGVFTIDSRRGPWTDLGYGSGSTATGPRLTAGGGFGAGAPFQLHVRRGPAGGLASLVVGFDTIFAPIGPNVLVPALDVQIVGLPLDGSGALVLPATAPATLPSGLSVWFQAWLTDGGPLVATNALLGVSE